MEEFLLEAPSLFAGILIERKDRFTLQVMIDSKVERVYLPNPGRLTTVIHPGREILCKMEGGYLSAFSIRVKDFWVTVDSKLANEIFRIVIEKRLLADFKDFFIKEREKFISEYGRVDFLLENLEGKKILVEVKSSTHVEDGVAKFPDSPTKRGRKHLKALKELLNEGFSGCIFFVVQRPDANYFTSFKEVDPAFASLLRDAFDGGVRVRALTTLFLPPKLYLRDGTLPVFI
jgi:sugar fermentation stimulation protein A